MITARAKIRWDSLDRWDLRRIDAVARRRRWGRTATDDIGDLTKSPESALSALEKYGMPESDIIERLVKEGSSPSLKTARKLLGIPD